MIGCEWMDGKVVGRMVAGWWEGGVPLELQRGSQGLARVASEKSGPFSS